MLAKIESVKDDLQQNVARLGQDCQFCTPRALVKSCLGLPAPSSQAEVSGWAMVVNLNKQLQAARAEQSKLLPTPGSRREAAGCTR